MDALEIAAGFICVGLLTYLVVAVIYSAMVP